MAKQVGMFGSIKYKKNMTDNEKEIERLKNQLHLEKQMAQKNIRRIEELENRSLLERIFNFDL